MLLLGNRLLASSLAFFCLALISCVTAAPGDTGKLIKTFPSITNEGQSYQLFLPSCKQAPCHIEVQLVNKQQTLDTIALPWSAASQELYTGQAGKWYGFGDPLDSSSQYTAWTIGTEYENVSIVAQLVQLDKNNDGLLVVQTAGFEHVRRYHSLYTTQGQKLIRPWQQEEAPGPSWSTAIIYPLTSSTGNNMLYLSAIQYSAAGAEYFDELNLHKLHWDKTSNSVKISSVDMPLLHYIVIYPYQNLKDANEQLSKHRSCLNESILILDGKKMFPTTQSTAVLAVITQDKQFASNARKKFKQCIPEKSVKILTQ